jgi:glycosyltransferase involved in cell wall biosynthesis
VAWRIGVLDSIAQVGGAEISLLELIRRLDGTPKVTLILPEDGPLRDKASRAGIEVCVLPWPERLMTVGERAGLQGIRETILAAGASRGLAGRLAQLLRSIDADGLITNGIKAHILGAAARSACDIPLLWYFRDGLEGRRLSSLLLRLYSSRCSGVIAISRYVESEARRVLANSVPVHVLYNIVDPEVYRSGIAPPADLVKTPGEIWYGVVGAITPLKGQDLFLRACREVGQALPEARFLIVGGNFYRTEARMQYGADLHRQVRESGLQDRVHFLGHRSDMPRVLSTLDVLVQPNRGPEGLGRSVLEAMACAVPVIAVDRWGPAELIQDGETGLLAPWMDVAALAERMIRLGRDAKLRARLGGNGRNWVLQNLVPEALVARFREIIDSHMTSRRQSLFSVPGIP